MSAADAAAAAAGDEEPRVDNPVKGLWHVGDGWVIEGECPVSIELIPNVPGS